MRRKQARQAMRRTSDASDKRCVGQAMRRTTDTPICMTTKEGGSGIFRSAHLALLNIDNLSVHQTVRITTMIMF